MSLVTRNQQEKNFYICLLPGVGLAKQFKINEKKLRQVVALAIQFSTNR